MRAENQANRKKFLRLLHEILRGKGVEAEILLDDKHYASLTFRIAPEDLKTTELWVMSSGFFTLMRKFKIEVIVIEYGDGVKRAVVQMREGAVRDRLLYAKDLQELAESMEMKIRVYCSGQLFDTMNIEGRENIEVEAFLVFAGTDTLKKRLSELNFVSCIIKDDRFTSDLLAPGKVS